MLETNGSLAKLAIQESEWMVWMDADIVITDRARRFDGFIAESMVSGQDIVLSDHSSNLNNGVIAVRNTPWARDFFDGWTSLLQSQLPFPFRYVKFVSVASLWRVTIVPQFNVTSTWCHISPTLSRCSSTVSVCSDQGAFWENLLREVGENPGPRGRALAYPPAACINKQPVGDALPRCRILCFHARVERAFGAFCGDFDRIASRVRLHHASDGIQSHDCRQPGKIKPGTKPRCAAADGTSLNLSCAYDWAASVCYQEVRRTYMTSFERVVNTHTLHTLLKERFALHGRAWNLDGAAKLTKSRTDRIASSLGEAAGVRCQQAAEAVAALTPKRLSCDPDCLLAWNGEKFVEVHGPGMVETVLPVIHRTGPKKRQVSKRISWGRT